MEPKDATLSGGLFFFGKITANMTHEIKNVLAVINEISGLFSDLCAAAERGRPLDPAQISRLSGKMGNQIQRADAVVKKLNRFAHSIDSECQEMGLLDILEFFCAITRRLSEQKNISVSVAQNPAAGSCALDPYGLMLILFLALEIIWKAADKGSAITISARQEADGAVVSFSGPLSGPLGPSEERKAFWEAWLSKMDCRAESPGREGALEISFPTIHAY